jgi:hypothetical protein
MTLSAGETELAKEEPLPRRDWIILPLISILTIVLVLGSTEWISRRIFAASKTGYERCMVLDDPKTGARGIPNSVCWEKAPEGPWIEYQFNSCGHRASMECGPKPAGTYRIVLIGSSVPLGQRVQRDDSFAALLPEELTHLTGHPVELYNEAMGFSFSHSTTLRFKEVLAAQPDLVLWVVTPLDVSRGTEVVPERNPDSEVRLNFVTRNWRRVKAAFASNSIETGAAELFSDTKTAYMLQHYLYESQSEALDSFLRGPDVEAGYLRVEPSAAWQGFLSQFQSDAQDIGRQAKAAGIPVAVTLVPGRAQTAMISLGAWPTAFDPYKLNEELRSIVVNAGGRYIDILPDFRNVPNPERLYFPVDGHPNVQGNAAISLMLAKGLATGTVPELRAAAGTQSSAEQGR